MTADGMQARTFWPVDYGVGHIDGHPVVLARGGNNYYDHNITTRDDLTWRRHATIEDGGTIGDARRIARLLNSETR